jgi:hypothetical protein
MATKIQNRRDTAANWTANDPTLSDGEIGFETDTGLFKIGANNTAWTSLAYAQVAGPTGPEGEPGAAGATGPEGAPGADGQDGMDGVNGLNGADGANGENGAPGLSAYEVWLDLGNSGSEQDFIYSLYGVDGQDGAPGQDGADGADGVDGVDGMDGADGDPSDIQKLVFSYGASSPNTNSGNWTNSTIYSNASGIFGFPDIYSQSFNIEKTSATSVIEISFDAVFDIAFNQNLGWDYAS